MKLWTLVLGLALVFAGVDADARRLGGGGSFGKQSGNVTNRQAPVTPPQNVSNAAGKPATAGAAAPRRPWGAMLGGLAAGLGLAWLAHSLGFGEAFGQVLMLALLAMVAVGVIGWLMRRNKAAPARNANAPFAFQGAGTGGSVEAPRPYRPENVGNDASARPWERSNAMPLEAMGGNQNRESIIGSALLGSQSWGIPAGFDVDGFLKAAKANFVTLQAAWDKSDISSLRAMMTDEMLGEIKTQLAEREAHTGGPVNHTDVVMIDAKLLGVEDIGSDYMASVEFSGMIREEPSAGPSPFREVWNMTKPKSGSSGWLVAGVQALQ
ncbi:MAG: Tim44 domain-containing protein [Rhodoferax sp.]|nr:Tim44 domain-containing protein [Rhodoferax sp.]MBP9927749.1 Tim44 domain-containing protein [Rhodoferax sp.]HQZ07497.1 TIM44-like domain-containing protein [Burkholderiaceae bacterium]HRA61219.1 TIM44-like domain-containing protein [Burkholderiaceae bacterium]